MGGPEKGAAERVGDRGGLEVRGKVGASVAADFGERECRLGSWREAEWWAGSGADSPAGEAYPVSGGAPGLPPPSPG